ncbi:sugar phosphate isomerase/epimerase family protein [Marinilactibacillus psychrotolerans]|uniref:sugar phosphate isomerase/epimerase family protein n=1 Tax=Marinilactibacillus psychrotolerans TaxID=191770 RepID=UPI0039AEC080
MEMNEKPMLSAINCHHRFYELECFFKSSNESGYRFVEIWTGPQHFFIDYRKHENVKKILELEQKYSIKVIGICPEQTNPKPNNIAAKDLEMQSRVLNYFKNVIDVACEVKANQVVVTSGWAFYNESIDDAYSRSIRMLQKISDYAEEKGIYLAIEALQESESLLANNIDDLKRLLVDVNRQSLKICLDLGAMAAAGDSIQEYFDTFNEDIIHAHFVDVKDNITHLAWGDGSRNMRRDIECFERNNYKGVLSVECINNKYFLDPQTVDKQSMEIYKKIGRERE